MSDYKGDYAEDATVRITFNTFDSNGASVTITQLATTDVFVYKDGTVLGDPDAGVTLDLNEGAVNGSHRVSVDLSSDVQYATGADYEVQFKGADIDGNEVNIFVGEFSIENRFMRGTDGANTTVPDAAGVAPTAVENRQEMDSNSTQLAAIVEDTGTTLENRQVVILADVTGLDGDVMRGTDGANTTVPDAAGVAPTAVENRQEMDSNSTQLAAIIEDTGTTLENRQVAILADVTGIDGDAMRGTDGANTTVPDAAGTAPTVDEIWAKAMSDLAGIPAFNASVLDAINISFMALRNKQTGTAAAQTIANDAGATIATAVLSDAAGTTTKEEYS
jgi:hypothetical protein